VVFRVIILLQAFNTILPRLLMFPICFHAVNGMVQVLLQRIAEVEQEIKSTTPMECNRIMALRNN